MDSKWNSTTSEPGVEGSTWRALLSVALGSFQKIKRKTKRPLLNLIFHVQVTGKCRTRILAKDRAGSNTQVQMKLLRKKICRRCHGTQGHGRGRKEEVGVVLK